MRNSIECRITNSLIVSALLIGILATSIASCYHYASASDEQDEQLKLIGNLIAAASDSSVVKEVPDEDDPDADIFIGRPGQTIKSARVGNLVIPAHVSSGFSDPVIGDQHWRGYATRDKAASMAVVLQRKAVRTDAVIEGALTAGLPILASLLAMIFVMRVSIVRAFASIKALGEQIGKGKLLDDANIAALPAEIRPFAWEVAKASLDQREMQRGRARFVANVAHELRSPLAALAVQIDNVATVELSDEARRRLDRVRGGLKRTADLLQQLLDLSRLQERGSKDSSHVDVAAVTSEAIEHTLPLATAREIEFRVNRLDAINFRGSRVALFSLLRNAIDNAVRYSPPHSVVELSLVLADNAFVISVSDQGSGMDDEDLKHAFEPFFRARENRDEVGSGLGLSIVAEAARELGGSARLKRRRLHGLTFEYCQPLFAYE